jgi:ATP:corrinoid adenosyltransferase
MEKLGIKTFVFARKHPHFYKKLNLDEVREECLEGIEFIRELFADETWDMLILDEMNITIRDGFLKEKEVLALLEAKPQTLELILTGRGATEEIIRRADLVSEIREVKHPYEKGIQRREGIEY